MHLANWGEFVYRTGGDAQALPRGAPRARQAGASKPRMQALLIGLQRGALSGSAAARLPCEQSPARQSLPLQRQHTSSHLLLSCWLPVPLGAPAPAPGITQCPHGQPRLRLTRIRMSFCDMRLPVVAAYHSILWVRCTDPARQLSTWPKPAARSISQASRASLRPAAGGGSSVHIPGSCCSPRRRHAARRQAEVGAPAGYLPK